LNSLIIGFKLIETTNEMIGFNFKVNLIENWQLTNKEITSFLPLRVDNLV